MNPGSSTSIGEPIATELTFPVGVTLDASGSVFVVEAGDSYGEVWTAPRLLRIDTDGKATPIATRECIRHESPIEIAGRSDYSALVLGHVRDPLAETVLIAALASENRDRRRIITALSHRAPTRNIVRALLLLSPRPKPDGFARRRAHYNEDEEAHAGLLRFGRPALEEMAAQGAAVAAAALQQYPER